MNKRSPNLIAAFKQIKNSLMQIQFRDERFNCRFHDNSLLLISSSFLSVVNCKRNSYFLILFALSVQLKAFSKSKSFETMIFLFNFSSRTLSRQRPPSASQAKFVLDAFDFVSFAKSFD